MHDAGCGMHVALTTLTAADSNRQQIVIPRVDHLVVCTGTMYYLVLTLVLTLLGHPSPLAQAHLPHHHYHQPPQ